MKEDWRIFIKKKLDSERQTRFDVRMRGRRKLGKGKKTSGIIFSEILLELWQSVHFSSNSNDTNFFQNKEAL